jgi:methionyl-tRNA formyltransferase
MNKKNSLPSLVFFGTPLFASYCLEALLVANFKILSVVTAPDRKAGRGKKLTSSPVKQLAESYELPIFQPTNLKEPKFVTQLTELRADIFVVVAFRMLPKVVWSRPKLGSINLHASLLPNYRGAAPINWVLINGEKKTGITTFFIDEKIDSGSVLLQKEVLIDLNDDAGSLHDKLVYQGAPLIIETLKGIQSGKLNSRKQNISKAEFEAPKLSAENTKIEWGSNLKVLKNKIKGLRPYPGAWSFFENNGIQGRLKILKAEIIYKKHSHPLNKVLVKGDEIYITNREGYLNCVEIQLPNKKRMSSKTLLNGYKFDSNARVL